MADPRIKKADRDALLAQMTTADRAATKAERISRTPGSNVVGENVMQFFDDSDRNDAKVDAILSGDKKRQMALDDIRYGVRHNNKGRKDIDLDDPPRKK